MRSAGHAAWFGIFFAMGCGAEIADVPSATSATSSSSSGAGGDATSLVVCDTTIAKDVPEFYQRYFRCVDIAMNGDEVVIHASSLPPHPSAYYGMGHPRYQPFDTMGGDRMQNPNVIQEQSLTLTITAVPVARGITIDDKLVDRQAGTSPLEYRPKPGAALGLALNGVAEFHGVAAPGDDLAAEAKTFDGYQGHPQMTGVYHYHGASPGPLEVLSDAGIVTNTGLGAAEVELFGIMCDGTLVLGCTELDGKIPMSSDFDAQQGHVHDIAAEGTTFFVNRYHTHACDMLYPEPFSPEIQYYQACNGE